MTQGLGWRFFSSDGKQSAGRRGQKNNTKEPWERGLSVQQAFGAQKTKTPPKGGVLSCSAQPYSGWATSVSLRLRLHCGSRVPISIPARLNSRPASCGGQKASSVRLYSR